MVSNCSQMLKKKYEGKLDAKADMFIGYTVEGAARMEQLIRDLLAYTRLTHSPEDATTVTDANEALASAISNLQAAIGQSRAAIRKSVLPQVYMRPIHLQQLFQNLLSNAIKYRREESPAIEVHAMRRDNEWLFYVKDNGIGIDEKYANDVFGIFKRLHTKEQYSGTGMGLAICKRIVEKYGGRIWVESKPGKGAVFLFTVPDASPKVPA
jgi:light-regulated signal transduction histidine kinase (bacteriophytochrome)